ncbi:rano class II histocompatibility antigen, A beta chain-like isoform X3 [Electrophorus electricus]|uniref:rano class II histocompatibility antigen, A beta chain-like isoform X3 n=1 Tax=Electrophorus electricus TaxID=8005 RepID=UPI000F0A839C|nr:rano class II histocompatibility antigen, A beta chain-like isoform X3 [Electrophorus electricus]
MCEAPVFPVVIFIFGLSIPVNSHYLSTLVQCYTRGSLQNTEFTISMMYNRGKFLTYNSTENAFIGYSDYGAKWANNLNNRTDWLHSEAEKILSDCREYGAQVTTILNTTGIKVSWLRDGEPLTSEVTSTEELADGDWYYQIHSHLEHTPKSGEKISCVVEHASFQKPIVCDWAEPSLPETERSKLALGAVGLMLGVITAAAGLTYYRCKQSEWTSVLS